MKNIVNFRRCVKTISMWTDSFQYFESLMLYIQFLAWSIHVDIAQIKSDFFTDTIVFSWVSLYINIFLLKLLHDCYWCLSEFWSCFQLVQHDFDLKNWRVSIVRDSVRCFCKREINEINIITVSQEEKTYVSCCEVSVVYN